MTSGSASRALKDRHEALEDARAAQDREARKRTAIVRGAWLVALLVIGGLVTAALLSARPETTTAEGAATPFTLPVSDGTEASLSDFAGQPILLYFNEGAGCDACLVQMAAIEQTPGFAEAGVTVLPIVMNTAEQINADRVRLGVETPFALDDGTVSEAYGMLGTGMHAWLPGHGFVLIDGDGVQRWSGDYPSMWLDPDELLDIVTAELQ